jgi:polyhydroxyalkanoate synthesis regulator phasin
LEQAGEQKDERIEELESEAETAREENARLRERLAAVEETVSGLAAADPGGAATPADD